MSAAPGPDPDLLASGPDRPPLYARLLGRIPEPPVPLVAGLLAVTFGAALLTAAAGAPQPAPAPDLPLRVIDARLTAAGRTARFVQSQYCEDRSAATYAIASHSPDWRRFRYVVQVAAGTARAGRLELDVELQEGASSFRVVSASGTCHE